MLVCRDNSLGSGATWSHDEKLIVDVLHSLASVSSSTQSPVEIDQQTYAHNVPSESRVHHKQVHSTYHRLIQPVAVLRRGIHIQYQDHTTRPTHCARPASTGVLVVHSFVLAVNTRTRNTDWSGIIGVGGDGRKSNTSLCNREKHTRVRPMVRLTLRGVGGVGGGVEGVAVCIPTFQ